MQHPQLLHIIVQNHQIFWAKTIWQAQATPLCPPHCQLPIFGEVKPAIMMIPRLPLPLLAALKQKETHHILTRNARATSSSVNTPSKANRWWVSVLQKDFTAALPVSPALLTAHHLLKSRLHLTTAQALLLHTSLHGVETIQVYRFKLQIQPSRHSIADEQALCRYIQTRCRYTFLLFII